LPKGKRRSALLKRRSKMGVTIRQKVRGKGKPWWVFVAHNGKRKSFRVGDKAAAEAVASEIRRRLKTGEFQFTPKEKISTFGEYDRKWLNGYGETHLKYSTLRGYEGIFRRHLQSLHDKPIDQITRPELRELIITKQKEGLYPASVSRIKALVSVILSHALEDGLIAANPASRLGRLIKVKERQADVNPLTREEARAFLEAVRDNYPRYYPFFLCALRTGMRLGELLALEWGDIDFRGGFIEVRRNLVEGPFTTPKNHKTRRVDIPVNYLTPSGPCKWSVSKRPWPRGGRR
jgi:integrase